jgi:hypothetical protein
MINNYLTRLHAAAEHDAELSSAFVRVIGMVAEPASLLHPGVASRVMRASLRNKFRGAAGRSGDVPEPVDEEHASTRG